LTPASISSAREIDVSEVFHDAGGVFRHAGIKTPLA